MSDIPNPTDAPSFRCRVCHGTQGYKEYWSDHIVTAVIHPDIRDTAYGDKEPILIGYECQKCSILFNDPVRFSVPDTGNS